MANRTDAKKHDVLRKKTRLSGRRLLLQHLERRELMAGDAAPRLISVNPNAGEIFDLEENNLLKVSPSELTFRFDGGQQLDQATLSGIRITRSGGDGTFNDGNEQIIQPGFLGFGESERVVIARFAEPLGDDDYKIDIFGFDQPAAGIVGLRNTENQLFLPDDVGADRQTIDFEIEIGALVTAVVPQPIETINGVRVQQRNQVHVYFNNDPLDVASAENPDYYHLYSTAGTVENTDDLLLKPTSVEYDAAINRAVLTFGANTDNSPLTDLSDWSPIAAAGGAGTLRLRIGTSDLLPSAPSTLNLPADEADPSAAPGDTFSSARQLGPQVAGGSIVIDSEIAPTEEYLLQWPGATDEPGIREIRRNSQLVGRADTELGITTLYYNFKAEYGEDTQGNRLENAITPAQKQRVREALDLYEKHLGLRFVETADLGLQFVTGDLRAIEITADVAAGRGLSIYRSDDTNPGNGLLILDGAENFFDGYGFSPDARPSYFLETLRGVGSLLGIGDTFEQPPGTAAGSEDDLSFAIRPEPDFLSQSDITAGQHLFRPEGRDIDLYRFSVEEAGRLTAETFAERLAGSSLLNTSLTLWRHIEGGGADDFELVARNDDFYSNDSFVGVDLSAGEYVVGVSAAGNDSYDPAIEGSGLGGRSEGKYQLRLVFQAADNDSLVDTNGTPLDGDADGVAGGTYNFWFRTARPVPAAAENEPRTIFVSKDGSDTGTGALGAPLRTIDEAMRQARAGDIVRLLPHAGGDGNIDSLQDNLAYEIGKGGVGNQELQDGQNLEVKRGVTVMIDAGSILKLRGAQITTGSSAIDTDRSQSALQVLGTPILVDSSGVPLVGSTGGNVSGRVIFTSYDDQQVGLDTNPLQTSPGAGQWGGLSFRNDVDYAQGRPVNEAEGIFLNYVGQADIRYGGGTVGGSDPVTPIQMSEARPALKYNIIRNSADAAISADPNSFEETNFHAPVYQRAVLFTSDYDRVGPDLAGNRFIDNTINGLFVRIDTPTTGQLEPMTVSGRFDDADVTHVLAETLVLQGTPGGPLLQTQVPSVLSVTVDPTAAPADTPSTLAAGSYEYRLTFVDIDGSESLASDSTRSAVITAGQAVRLAALPAAPNGFVGRRLYRLNAAGEYEFVTQLNRSQGTYTDTGITRGGLLTQLERPDVSLTTLTPQASFGGLSGTFNYRFTFVDANGNELLASEPTRSTTVVDQAIRLTNLPVAPSGYQTRLYRLIPSSGQYAFVAQLSPFVTSYIDNDTTLGEILDPTIGSTLRPRYDARLSVDPGVVIKLQTSRIETTFGADFYAEGVDGREIIFTSRQDDRYGAGGTFDTNNDGSPVAGGNQPVPGDWGGLGFGQGSDASIDYALITFGGGNAPSQGNFSTFNAVEILQAEARIAHTTFESNADGLDDSDTRGGYGFNDAAALFVRGAQPIIIDNVFRDNAGAAISINPDALDFSNVTDWGRSTGAIDRLDSFGDNQGPLVRLNQLDDNGINGMVVRSEVLTTESVWDDTDIVHVVGGDIITVDHHYNGGLRLESSPGESLVVKVTDDARLLATGRPLDIDDRIGGTLQILGQPGFPVVLTSINDDSVGAGFAADGRSQNDTNGGNALPQPGDWQGIILDAFANDRNVQIVLENEPALSTAAGQNAIPGAAQGIGVLAKHEKAGDENERLGFSVHGTLSDPGDVDVYSFKGTGGTEVWIDLDRTTYALDSVVELIDQNGNITVLSDDSFREASDPDSIHRDSELPDSAVHSLNKAGKGQIETPNPGDAGFRVILPGAAGVANFYYVRVRSSNLAPGDPTSDLWNESLVREGHTQGAYRLGIRLREIDEIAGSTVQFADIRYAVNGIDLVSAPLHSPLAGEAAERLFGSGGNLADQNDDTMSGNRAIADPLGNLLSTDRAALYVSGAIGNQSITFSPSVVPEEDIDLFRLDLFYDSLETEIFLPDNRYVPLTFDIDYSDGLGRVNTSISIYNAAGQLILTGRDSNIAGDVGTPLEGVDSANLTAGSAGVLDAHIGPVELPEGVYYVAVHSDVVMPAPFAQYINPNAANPLVRMMPIDSVRTITSDDLDGRDFTADQPLDYLLDDAQAVPYTLEDVTLFIALDQGIDGGSEKTTIAAFDPFTGTFERTLGETGDEVSDLAMRGDGELYSYSTAPQSGAVNSGTIGNYLNISTQNGGVLSRNDDGLIFRRTNAAGTGTETDPNAELIINAMAFDRTDTSINGNDRVYVVGNRDNAGSGGEVPWTRNIMYSNVATTGATTNDGSTTADDRTFPAGAYSDSLGPASQKFEMGVIDTSVGTGGTITGLVMLSSNRFYAVDDQGGVYFVDTSSTSTVGNYGRVLETTFLGSISANAIHPVAVPAFSGLTWGPRATEGGAYKDTLFATTADGWLYAIGIQGPVTNPTGVNSVPKFSAGASAVKMLVPGGTTLRPVGLAFSTLEENPWHVTDDRKNDPGHGNYIPFDKTRGLVTTEGGDSLYFGFERTGNPADNTLERAEGDAGTLAPGGSHGSVVTPAFTLAGYTSADKPTVYFDYFLETENVNYALGDNPMRDSFRVFAAGDDGQWQLLSTNDSFRQFINNDEYDYFELTGIPVQELHDNTGSWRQARVDISPLAGNSQVRLRFDFSTAGGMSRLGFRNELQSVAGDQLTDGDRLQIRTPDPNGNPFIAPNSQLKSFEIDLGEVLDFPSGTEINPGDSFQVQFPLGVTSVSQTLTFTTGLATAGEVHVNDQMTSGQVADAVLAKLSPFIGAVRFGQASVGFTQATNVVNNADGSGVVVSSRRGVSGSATPINVRGDMTASEVTTALQTAFVIGLGDAGATVDNFKTYADRAVLFNHSVIDAGPFGLSAYLPGDEFGAFQSNDLDDNDARAGQNNTFEGVYLDNLMVGFAERGEMVINAPANNLNFIRNPESDPEFEQPERPNEILTGAYALEIRRSAEYGVPDDYDPINLLLDEFDSLGRSFDTNDRLDNAVTLVAQPGGEIRDGDIFVLTDGTQEMTFEFDSAASPGVAAGRVAVPFDPRVDDATVVAAAIRDAINSPQVQSVLDVRAESSDSREVGTTTSDRINLFGDHVFVNPTPGRNLKVDLIKEENFRDRVAAQTRPWAPTPGLPVQYLLEPDTLARAYPTQYVNGQTDTLVAIGKIGDRVTTGTAGEVLGDAPRKDMDIIKIHLFGGDEIDIDIDAVTTAKGRNQLTAPRLSVYAADGSFLGSTGSGKAPGESVTEAFLRFTAPADGYYYVAVDNEWFSFGEYQLTVRPSTDQADVLYVDYHMDQGDLNRVRDQGQILIASNVITDSRLWGITATAGDRNVTAISPGAGTALPKPGNARLLRNENTARLLPGSVITNNLIVGGGSGGIQFAGDASASGTMQGGVPFGRIVNNTVVGRPGSGDIGIDVGINASPTVLNNILSGFDTGIRVNAAATSQTTVVGGNIFKDNGSPSNFALGNLSFNLDSSAVTEKSLFTDAANRIYIPASGSLAIDSSFASLSDRQAFVDTVKQPSGISRSPIVAPPIDTYGQPRVDDPLVETPAGVGANVFIDRGALDRADFVGPLASIAVPTDFIEGQGGATVGGDIDGASTFIRLASGTLEYFEIQLLEPAGSGPNAMTVLSEAVVLTENGRRLIAGVDYNFGYSDTSNTIRLTPLSGIWRPDGAYEVTLNNRDRIVLQAPAGNDVQDGDQIIVTDENGVRAFLEFETGFVLEIPQTLSLVIPFGEGGANGFRDGDQFEITQPDGTAERFELNVFGDVSENVTEIPIAPGSSAGDIRDAILTVLSARAADLNLAPVAVGTNQIQIGSMGGHAVDVLVSPLQLIGTDRGVTDGDTLTYDDGLIELTFEFNLTGDLTTASDSDVIVTFDRTDTPIQLAEKLAIALRDSDLNLANPRALGDGRIHVGGSVGDTLDTSNSTIGQTGTPRVTDSLVMEIAASGSEGFAEGDQFSITHNGTTTLFEFGFDRDVEVGAEPIQLTVGEGAEAVAARIIDAIRNASIGLDPIDEGDGRIRLNEPFGYELNLLGFAADPDSAALTASGVPGGAVSVAVVPSASLTPDVVAALLASALRQTPLASEVFTPGGGTLWFSNTQEVSGIETLDILAIRDLAGNRLQPNRANEETQFTILLPDVQLDFGDAPESYGTLVADNGARHTRSNHDVLRLGELVDTEADGQPISSDGDDEDGVGVGEFVAPGEPPVNGLFVTPDGQFLSFLNPLAGVAEASVSAIGSGLLDAWIDYNQDGDWDDLGEQVLTNALVLEGDNRFQIPVLDDALEGLAWARFRLSPTGNQLSNGVSIGGEVEDFQVRVVSLTPPTMQDDAYAVDEDNDLLISEADGVLIGAGADTFVGLHDVRSVVENEPLFGSVVLEEDGSFSYTPADNFYGTDTFTYRIFAMRNLVPGVPGSGVLPVRSTGLGTVTITVNPVNDVPVAEDKGFATLEDDGDGTQVLTVTAAELLANAAPGDFTAFPEVPDEPWNEQAQTLRISAITVAGTVLAPAGLDVETLSASTPQGSLITAHFSAGALVDLTYQPTDNYNRQNTLNATEAIDPDVTPLFDEIAIGDLLDSFTFTVTDDGLTEFPQGMGVIDGNGDFVTETTVSEESTTRTAFIRVDPVNDPPEFGGAATVEVLEDAGDVIVDWADYIRSGPENALDELPQNVSFVIAPASGFETEAARIFETPPQLSAYVAGGDPGGELTFRPALHQNGSAVFVITATDDGSSWFYDDPAGLRADARTTTFTLTLTVDPVNDAPEFDGPDLVRSLEDGGAVDVQWTETLRPGPVEATDEVDQVVTFVVTQVDTNNPNLFEIAPAVDSSGRLTYTAAAHQVGAAVFMVVGTDNGPNNDPTDINDDPVSDPVFVTIAIDSVNDAPEFGGSPTVSVLEDAGDVSIDWATFLRPGPEVAIDEFGNLPDLNGLFGDAELENVTFTIAPAVGHESEAARIFETQPELSPYLAVDNTGGNLTFRPALHQNGSAVFVITATDNGTTWSNDDPAGLQADALTTTFTLTLTVDPVNDAPEFDGPDLMRSLEDGGAVDVQWTETLRPGPVEATDEVDQVVTFVVTQVDTNNPNLFEIAPAVDSSGRLTYTAAAHQVGAAVFMVVGTDNGPNNDPTDINDDPVSEPVFVTIAIDSVNDAPEFGGPSTVSVLEDAGDVSIDWATFLRPGPEVAIDEFGNLPDLNGLFGDAELENVTFTIAPAVGHESEAARIFETQPELSPYLAVDNTGGNLTFRPALHQNGSAVFVITATDNGTTWSNDDPAGLLPDARTTTFTLTLTVDAVNDAPEFAGPSELEVQEDSGSHTIDWADFIRSGPEVAGDELSGDVDSPAQTVTLSIAPDPSSTFPAELFVGGAAGITIDDNGMVSFTPAVDAVGSGVFIVTATDSGVLDSSRGDVNFAQQTLTIHIRPKNDAPRVTVPAPAEYGLLEDHTLLIPLYSSGPGEPAGLLDQFSVGPDNEADAITPGGNQSLSVVGFAPKRTLHGTIEPVLDTNDNVIALLYQPDADFNSGADGSVLDTFFYTVTDDGVTFNFTSGSEAPDPLTAEYMVDLRVQPVNDAPSFTLGASPIIQLEDGGTTSIPDWATSIVAGPITATDETDPTTGQTVTFDVEPAAGYTTADLAALFSVAPAISTDGTLTFTPAANAVGTIVVQVTADDGGDGSETGRGDENFSQTVLLTLTLAPVNDAPVAEPSVLSRTLDEDGSIDLPIHNLQGTGLYDIFRVGPANEADGTPGGNQTLSTDEFFFSPTTPNGNLVAYSVDGVFAGLRYTPDPNFNGSDTFVFGVVDDGQTYDLATGLMKDDSRGSYATVSLTINAVNDRPQFAGAPDVSVSEDSTTTSTSGSAGVTVIPNWVTNVLAGPATADDENGGATAQDVSFVITRVSGTDSDELFAELPTVDPLTGELRFRTVADANGRTVFQMIAQDNGPQGHLNGDPARPENLYQSLSRQFVIEVTAGNDPPIFTPGADITLLEDNGPYNSLWATNISPGPADELGSGQAVLFDVSVAPGDQAKFSDLPTLSDDGLLRFTPAANASGNVDILITARDTDGAAALTPYTLSLTITPTNDAPVAVDDNYTATEDSVLTLTTASLLDNDQDADFPQEELSVTGFPTTSLLGATVTLSTDGSTITYDPTGASAVQALRPDQLPATDVFTYQAVDQAGVPSGLATVTLTITGINDAPVARPDAPVLHPTNPTTFFPLSNDTDLDGSLRPSSVVITLQPAFGTLAVSPAGAFTYTPSASFQGSDIIRYAVRDDLGALSQSAEIRIGVNHPPVADADSVIAFRNDSVTFAVLDNDGDSDGTLDPTTVEILSGPAHGQTIVHDNGTITYVPTAEYVGNDSFTYQVLDDDGAPSNVATVSLRVLASTLQNPGNSLDVDDSGEVSPIDALLIINYLNRGGSPEIDPEQSAPPYLDVDGSGQIGPLDALRVINSLNRAEGEGEGSATPLQTASNPSVSDGYLRIDSPETLDASRSSAASGWDFAQIGDLDDDRLDDLLEELAQQRDDSSVDGAASLDAVWESFGASQG